MSKIYIKSTFTPWHEVTKEEAKIYVDFLLQSMVKIREEDRPEYINKNHLKGITVEELFKGEMKK